MITCIKCNVRVAKYGTLCSSCYEGAFNSFKSNIGKDKYKPELLQSYNKKYTLRPSKKRTVLAPADLTKPNVGAADTTKETPITPIRKHRTKKKNRFRKPSPFRTPFPCQFCGKIFESKEAVEMHTKDKHWNNIYEISLQAHYNRMVNK